MSYMTFLNVIFFNSYKANEWSLLSSVSEETRTGRPRFNSRQDRLWYVFIHQRIQTCSGPTQLPIQWVPVALTPG